MLLVPVGQTPAGVFLCRSMALIRKYKATTAEGKSFYTYIRLTESATIGDAKRAIKRKAGHGISTQHAAAIFRGANHGRATS
jgi:hypothetical protein